LSRTVELDLTPSAHVQLLQEASRAYPLEACGALLGSVNRVIGLHPFTNRSTDPENSFTVDPVELEPLLRGEANGGVPVLGFYHSHPDDRPFPSSRDLVDAWSDYWYVIVGVDQGIAGPPFAWRGDNVSRKLVGLDG